MPRPPGVTPEPSRQRIVAAKISYESNGSDDSFDEIPGGLGRRIVTSGVLALVERLLLAEAWDILNRGSFR